MYRQFFKRFLDFLLALLSLLVLLPLFIFCFILVKLSSKGPFFFFQERLGKKGHVFKVYKMRTMTHRNRISDKEILKGNSEVTFIGTILRRLKIDELPQIINILIGDMSVVGPRPCLTSQINDFNEDGKMRLIVRPGLTGLAQTNGNIYLTWPERWKYDRLYVENVSFLLDMKIILKTFLIVLLGEEKFIKKPNV